MGKYDLKAKCVRGSDSAGEGCAAAEVCGPESGAVLIADISQALEKVN